MALTRDFAETVKARLQEDAEFRLALLKEAMDNLLEGDVDTGKALLRDFVNATLGFEGLADMIGMPAKSLHRMLGPNGNPRAQNLFRMLAALQKTERVDARVELVEGLGVKEPHPEYGSPGAARWARLRAASHRKKK